MIETINSFCANMVGFLQVQSRTILTIEFPLIMKLKRYWALAKAADKTDIKEDLPKTKNLIYIHSCHHANRKTAITQLC